MRKELALVAVGLSLTACEGRLPANVTRADSAGVTIITNAPGRMTDAPTWTLSARPVETIQTPTDGSYTLSRIGDVVPLPEGQVAVANGGSEEIFVFNEDGHLALRFSRKGAGPGQFRNIASLVPLAGDSLGVFDGSRRTLSVFSIKGVYARAVSLGDLMAAAGDATGMAQLKPLSNGDLALVTLPVFGDKRQEGVYRPESEWLRIDSKGEREATYGSFPGYEVYVADHGMGRPMFGRFTAFATTGKNLVVGRGITTQFEVRDPSGALSRIVRWPDHDRKVTDAKLDAAIEVAASTMPAAQQAGYRAMMKDMPHGEEEPPYESMVASDDGHVWVGGYPDETLTLINASPGPALHWLVFAPNGALAATVETPAGFQPKAVRGSRIFGVYRDVAGAESVRVYQVEGM